MINSAMSFVLLEGRSFTAPVPLSQTFHDQLLLATILRSLDRPETVLVYLTATKYNARPRPSDEPRAAWPKTHATVLPRQTYNDF